MPFETTRRLRPLLALLASGALVLACAGRIWPSAAGVRRLPWLEGQPLGNWARADRGRVQEWPYNHPQRRGGEPGLCVAFSGGGLRAASFAIGVLDGFHRKDVTREVDRASSVSGGGYALSWYLAHHYDAWKRAQETGQAYDATAFDRELFAADGAYQRQLEGGMDIVANPFTTHEVGASTVQATTALLLSVPMTAANLLANGVFGWHWNTSPMQGFYQARIERVFHRKPGSFSTLGFYDLGRGERIGFGDLRDLLDPEVAREPSSHLPFPIFVAAANLNHTGGSAALHVANRLFELTPKWSGSDAFSFHDERPIDMHAAVAVSAAALDSRLSLTGPPSLFASVLNMDLGYHIDNPIFAGSRAAYMARPFPLYFFGTGWQNDLEGARIHLTDGGHAENLGAYPLFRRLCRQTVIVDGTYDPNLGFDDYRVLREALRGELELEISIPAIDEWVRRQLAVSRILRRLARVDAEDLDRRRRVIDDLTLLKPAWVDTIGASYDPGQLDGDKWKDALQALRQAIAAHLERLREARDDGVPKLEDLEPDMAWLLLGPSPLLRSKGERWGQVLEGEVFEGVVRGLTRPDPAGGERDAELEVFYLKLSLPRSVRLDPTRCTDDEWGNEACDYHARKRAFPQEPTGDLRFDRAQYAAYRSLGRKLGERLCLQPEPTGGWWTKPGEPWSQRPLTTDCPD